MKVIGVTGGICSGKTTFCEMLETAGAAVVNCDNLGHESYLPGQKCHDKLVETFGAGILAADGSGQIDRKKLSAIVFRSKEEIAKLNAIVWPAIYELALEKIEKIKAEKPDVKVVFVEAALLLDASWAYDMCKDGIWVCHVPLDVAKERLMKRNNFSPEEAERRIKAQRDPEEFKKIKGLQLVRTDVTLEEMNKSAIAAYQKVISE